MFFKWDFIFYGTHSFIQTAAHDLTDWPLSLTHLMQDIFAQDSSKRDVWSSKIRRVNESVIERSGYNELRRSEEGSKVAVEVVLLLTSLAAGGRPQINGVSGDAHVDQAPGEGCHQYEAAQDDEAGILHTERTPSTEDDPQGVLKALTQRFTAWCSYWEETNTTS